MSKQIADSMMHSEQLFKISKEAQDAGLIIRYDVVAYRGQEVNFLSDVSGVQCFAQWNGQLIDLGLNNLYYKEDMCSYIDRQLDLITDFRNCPDFAGAKLEWFQNGAFRDIRLSYKDRILKVFLVVDNVDEIVLISEAENLLRNSGLLEE